MKRAVKIILPIFLIIAILVAAVWFFFFNSPSMTNQFLLSQADRMAQSGRHTRAIRYYTLAWSLEPQRDDIPIRLAETYAASGNYTKAEYTLVKGISNQPDLTELYAALCRIYVAQDKLLDAVQMLDRITDPNVKAELDQMRPAAPSIVPEGGYYNEYIDISVETQEPHTYLTTDGEYPSSDTDLYADPIALTSGETTALAISVSEDGLVSPVVRTGYTIGGVVESITLADPAMDQTVRTQLGLDPEAELMSDLLWSITHLSLPETVKDLSDLSKFTGLRSLAVNNISGLDLTILSQLPSLQELDLSGCTVSSNALAAIGSLTHLERLILDGCALTDISAFSQLTKLKELNLSNNSLNDVGVISLMPQLETLCLANNPLSSIAAVSACNKLSFLDISSCSISSLGSLKDKVRLQTLLASNNKIKNLDELSGCRRLSILEVNSNLIGDIVVLTKLPALTRFDANHNEISVIPDFDEESSKLIHFSVNYNQISDVSGLADIDSLNYLNIDYNKVSDLSPVSNNINLIKVNAWDNPVSEESVTALTQREIILNYNPNYEAPAA